MCCVCVCVGSVLSKTCPPHSTQSLFLSLKSKRALPHWPFLPFVSVLPKQLSMSATPACFPFSELQMGEESYFEFSCNYLMPFIYVFLIFFQSFIASCFFLPPCKT